MEHLLLKAATTAATDQGIFEAVISTATIDRERDIVDPDGMVRALRKWTNKRIPLAWNHSTKAEDQIGYIDPASARTAGGEVVASGWIDQSTPVGADAWRLVKTGTLGFSFGYLALKGEPRKGGGRHIRELDVFEVTATPTPMNNDTRVLGWKADKQVDDGGEDEDDPAELLGQMISLAQDFIDDETDPQDVAAMRQIMRELLDLQGTEADEPKALAPNLSPQEAVAVARTGKEPKARSVDPLRRMADAVALDYLSDGESRKTQPQQPRMPTPGLELSELKRRARDTEIVALEALTDSPPVPPQDQRTRAGLELSELKRRTRQTTLTALSGEEQ